MNSSTATPAEQCGRIELPSEILLINELHGLFEFLTGPWVGEGVVFYLFSQIFKQSSFFIILI